MKKKLSRFFTISRRHDAGFTLTELIIVIAILAILAGVAVPSYNLYVKKARERADLELIAAVNNAFAAACLESQIEVKDVSTASVSVVDNMVHGVSTVATEDTLEDKVINQIGVTFNALFVGNHETKFVTENVNSLQWNDEEDTFEISADYTNIRIYLANGNVVNVSAEDMQAIQNSAYVELGYSGVAQAIINLSKSGELLAKTAGTLGMMGRLTAAMKSYGLIDATKATQLENNLKLTNIGEESYTVAVTESSNGLQMVTAKYLSKNENAADELLAMDLGQNATGLLTGMVDSGGVKTVSAASLQSALIESFASYSEYAQTTITYETGGFMGIGATKYEVPLSGYILSEEYQKDPIANIYRVKQTAEWQAYVASPQYQEDKNGFVAILSILGDNLGTVTKQGNIDVNEYLASGIECQSAQDCLKAVLGD